MKIMDICPKRFRLYNRRVRHETSNLFDEPNPRRFFCFRERVAKASTGKRTLPVHAGVVTFANHDGRIPRVPPIKNRASNDKNDEPEVATRNYRKQRKSDRFSATRVELAKTGAVSHEEALNTNDPYICSACQSKNTELMIPAANTPVTGTSKERSRLSPLLKTSAGKKSKAKRGLKAMMDRVRGRRQLTLGNQITTIELNTFDKRKLDLLKVTPKVKTELEYNNPLVSGRTLDHYFQFGKPPFYNFGVCRNIRLCRY